MNLLLKTRDFLCNFAITNIEKKHSLLNDSIRESYACGHTIYGNHYAPYSRGYNSDFENMESLVRAIQENKHKE